MTQTPKPWEDWIPGVLSNEQIAVLCKQDFILGVQDFDKAIDYSAIDLCLDSEGYHMLEGSMKPSGDHYADYLKNPKLARPLTVIGKGGVFELESEETYVFKLRERLQYLPELKKAPIYGQATAKSSVGRVDVLARLIIEGMDEYESFTPEGLGRGSGHMYLEITPITFNVRVKIGKPLSQLRFFYGKPEDAEIKGDYFFGSCLLDQYNSGSAQIDNTISVDLTNTEISGERVAAFCAKKSPKGDQPINLWKPDIESEGNDPCKYWAFCKTVEREDRLAIRRGEFYILRSKEKISLPGGVAVYCRAMDEAIGEMRIHYAGFVHPFFGRLREDSQRGTPLTFEVRGHNVNVLLSHGEKMAKLTFYRMSSVPKPKPPNGYSGQTLELSAYFKNWPARIKVNPGDGSVTLP